MTDTKAQEAPNGIVLWHYPFSPFARRVVWYLTLRGIEYAECVSRVFHYSNLYIRGMGGDGMVCGRGATFRNMQKRKRTVESGLRTDSSGCIP